MAQQPASCSNCGGALMGGPSCPTCGAAHPAAAPAAPLANQLGDSRSWAMGVHLSALAGAFIGGIGSWVGPLVIWLLRRDSDPFVAEHAREALNFNLTVAIAVVVGIIFTIFTLGLGGLLVLPAGLVLGIFWLIWTIQATSAASRGQTYRYPLTLRMIRD